MDGLEQGAVHSGNSTGVHTVGQLSQLLGQKWAMHMGRGKQIEAASGVDFLLLTSSSVLTQQIKKILQVKQGKNLTLQTATFSLGLSFQQ